MTAVYDLFVRRVAEGRGVAPEAIAKTAEGRIFAGHEARDQHLVDEWGGLDRALAVAKELAHLDENIPVQTSGESGGLLEWLDDEPSADESDARGWLGVATHAIRGAASGVTEGRPPEE